MGLSVTEHEIEPCSFTLQAFHILQRPDSNRVSLEDAAKA